MKTLNNNSRPVNNNMLSLKSRILKSLPKEFQCEVSKTGLIVKLWVDTNKVGGWDNANRLVYAVAKKFKLNEVGAGTDMTTMVRDWEFIDTSVEKKMIADAKDTLKVMKNFFKKYHNTYCSSNACYDIIEQMRKLIETDEV